MFNDQSQCSVINVRTMADLELGIWNLELFFVQQPVDVIDVIEAIVNMKVKLWNYPELFSDLQS